MFEVLPDTSTQSVLQSISLQTIFDKNQEMYEPKLNELLRAIQENDYRNYILTNTRADITNTIKRPDTAASLKLFKEICTKDISLGYVNLNILLSLEENLIEKETENFNKEDTQKVYQRLLNPFQYINQYNNIKKGCIVIVNVIKGSSFLTKLKKLNEKNANTDNIEYTRLKDIELELLESKFDNTLVIQAVDNITKYKVIFLVTNKYNWRKFRKIISKVPEFYEDLIIKETKETYKNKIKDLFKALDKDTNDNSEWREKLLEILNDQERINQKQAVELAKLIEFTKKEQLEGYKQNIRNNEKNIEEYYDRVRLAYAEIRKEEGKILKLEEDPELREKLMEVIEYANKSKLITDFEIKAEQKKINVTIDAPIRYFDPEYAKALNKSLKYMEVPESEKAFKELFIKIFLEDKVTLYCSTKLELRLYPRDYSALTYNVRTRVNENEIRYVGQPHLNEYACFGNNKIEMEKACSNFDILGLLTIITASTQNFNLTDSTVFRNFKEIITTVANDKKTFKDNETGEFFSFNDFKRKLTEKKLETEKAKQAVQKYKNKFLNREQINYLTKALKAIGEMYFTGNAAKQVVAALLNENNKTLESGTMRLSSYYDNIETKEYTLLIGIKNNVITGKTILENYFVKYDKKEDEQSSIFFTDFLDVLEEENNTTQEQTTEANVTIPTPF